MYQRNIIDKVKTSLANTPVTLVSGARRTGKTTLVKALCEQLGGSYLTLDDPGALSLAGSDPVGFIKGTGHLTAIDEAHLVPELFKTIKVAVDSDSSKRFLLTGSANIMLIPKLGESLAGRIDTFNLMPLSQGELAGKRETFIDNIFNDKPLSQVESPGRTGLFDLMVTGGYPQVVTQSQIEARHRWFDSYVEMVTRRDIRELANIDAIADLPRVLRLLATRAGGLLNIADISRSLAIPQTTLRRFINLLETVFLVTRTASWSTNRGKRLAKAPKLYFGDSGLLAHLLRYRTREAATEPYTGPILENFVVNEIAKVASWSNTDVDLFHYRTHKGAEVDLLLEGPGGRLAAIEVKASATARSSDFAAIKKLADEYRDLFVFGAVLYTGDTVVPASANMYALPIESIWA